MAAPPDLRVVCRSLVSTPADDLLTLCPSLVHHVLQCGRPLSAPADLKPKDASGEAAMLVHRLKTHIGTLVNGKTPASRFAGMALVKAVVDVGGWECLRTAEPWVRGLLSMLQKPDPLPVKALCVVTLARIYTLLHEYPTLVREIATPTIPTFANACLQILKLSSAKSSKKQPPPPPPDFVETVLGAFAALLPLYPATLRPFNAQVKAVIRPYLAPTCGQSPPVPPSLQQASRRLAVLLHHTAPKNTQPEVWAAQVAAWIDESHATLDQVFRAVHESWEPPTGHPPRAVSTNGDPHGGGALGEDKLPTWSGLGPGASRLTGLLETLSEAVRTPTKSTVTLPVGAMTDLAARILLVTGPAPGAHDRDLATQLNPGIGRDERDELWSALPDLHVAALQLQLVLMRRLGAASMPLASAILDQAVRAHAASPRRPATRHVTFALIRQVLLVCGPTLPKISVDSLAPALQDCCHVLLSASGFATDAEQPSPFYDAAKASNGAKPAPGARANADLFLPNKDRDATRPGHHVAAATNTAAAAVMHAQRPVVAAARALLEAALSRLPQQHVRKADRALLDRTAILSRSRAALLAGVLHPYVDGSGRLFANTYPFLARQHPRDAAADLLRTNLCAKPLHFGNVLSALPRRRGTQGDGDEEEDDDDDDGRADEEPEARTSAAATAVVRHEEIAKHPAAAAVGGFARHLESIEMDVDDDGGAGQDKPAEKSRVGDEPSAPFVPLVLKRKSVEVESDVPAKRQDKGKTVETAAKPAATGAAGDDGGNSSSDDESVQLEMAFEDDDDDEDEQDDD